MKRHILGTGRLVIYTDVEVDDNTVKIKAYAPQSVGLHTGKGKSKRLKLPDLLLGKKVRLVLEVV